MYQFSFEKLEIWQISRKLVKTVYLITKRFPSDEKYALTSQLRKTSISISTFIAEGVSNKKNSQKAASFESALSSLFEVMNLFIIAHDLRYINDEVMVDVRLKMEDLLNKLNSFVKLLHL